MKRSSPCSQRNGFPAQNHLLPVATGTRWRDGEKLKFGQFGSTRMAGPPEAMQVESAFLAALASVTHWKLADGTLALLSDGKTVAGFTHRAAGESR